MPKGRWGSVCYRWAGEAWSSLRLLAWPCSIVARIARWNGTRSVSGEQDGLTRIDRNVDRDARRVDTHFV